MRLSLVVPLIICGSLSPSLARANDAAARAASDRADALKQEGKLAESCAARETAAKEGPDFKRKWAIGICYEELGKTATAWLAYDAALQFALAESSLHPNDDLVKEQARRAKIKVDQIAPTVPKLRLVVMGKVEGLTIFRGEEAIADTLWSGDIALDPGDYSLAANAPGYQEFTVKATMKVGEVTTITIPALTCEQPLRNGSCPPCGEFEAWSTTAHKCECTEGYARDAGSKACMAKSPGPIASTTTSPEPTASATPTTTSPPPANKSGGIPIFTWVLGGAGIVGLGTGVVFSIVSTSKYNDSTRAGNGCDSVSQTCVQGSPGAQMQADSATDKTLAIVSYIAGGALLGAGIVVWAVGSGGKESAPKTSVLLTPGGLSIVGSF